MFTRLLVPLDGSLLAESSLPAARALGRRLGAAVVLYHAVERGVPATVHGDRHLTAEEEAARYLDGVAAWLARQGIRATPQVDTGTGDVAGRIAAAAARQRADLVVLSRHGSGGLRGLLFGRVAQQVLQRGTVPVLLVPPSAAGREQGFACRRVLVPLDGSATAEAAVPVAAALAGGFGAEVDLAMVIPTVETISGERAAATRLMPTAAAAVLDAEADDGAAYLQGVAKRVSDQGVPTHPTVERGEPVRTLLTLAADRNADLIIIATHGRSGVGAVWAGSVAQRVIAQSPRPVLLVRITGSSS